MTLFLISLMSEAQLRYSGIKFAVSDVDNKEPIAGAVITVKESKAAGVSDAKGNFQVQLPPGTYTLEFKFLGYKTSERKVVVTPGLMVSQRVYLKSSARELNQVTVEGKRTVKTEKALLEIRRKSANIQDAISAEQIEKSASITTAQALQKVTGVSVRDGRYVSVRGLTDRNLVVQMNGVRLPGADASRSAVPLDLIPAQLLDNIIVEKSVTPDKPADATGAVIDIQTRSIPDLAFVQFTAQSGVNSNIGPYGYYNSYPDARLGFFGQRVSDLNLGADFRKIINEYTARGYSTQDGTLRSALARTINAGVLGDSQYQEAQRIDRAVRTFTPYLATQPGQADLNKIFGVSFGDRKTFRSGKVLGYVFGLNYYERFSSSPSGVNNRYSVKENNSPAPNIVLPNELTLISIYNETENTGIRQLNYGGLASVAFRFNPANEVSLVYNGNFGAEANSTLLSGTVNSSIRPGDLAATTTISRFDRSRTYDFVLKSEERPLHQIQLRGEHRFKPFYKWKPWKLNWNASNAFARQSNPNYRDTRLVVDSLGRTVVVLPDGARNATSDYQYGFKVSSTRYFRGLEEKNQNYKFDLIMPFNFNRLNSNFKIGSYFLRKDRRYTESSDERIDSTRSLNRGTAIDFNGLAGQVPRNIVSNLGDVTLWSSGSAIGIVPEATSGEGRGLQAGYIFVPRAGPNSYRASFQAEAFYAMTDWNISKSFRLVGGLRVESTDIQGRPDTVGVGYALKTVQINGRPVKQPITTQEEFDQLYRTNYLTYSWLPSGSLIYSGIRNMSIRLAVSKTISRPEINEIVNASQFDPLQQAFIQGNVGLKNGIFKAYDFRYDWFVRPEELISASLFYKKITDQIERVYLPGDPSSGQYDAFGRTSASISFRNNGRPGYVYGLELEVRKRLDQLFPVGKYIILGVNSLIARSTTVIDSAEYQVATIFDRNLSRNRPLIDQPNYVININMGFDYPKWGSQFNVLFNKTGKRLVEINVDGSPNIYQFPAATLDFTASQKIKKGLTIKFFAKNVLNEGDIYLYSSPNNTKSYGVKNQIFTRRSTSFGGEYTFGISYIL